MLGPMGSNLQRILGIMTPDSVKRMVETANASKEDIVLKVNTTTDDKPSKNNQDSYASDKNNEDTDFIDLINNPQNNRSNESKKEKTKLTLARAHSQLYETNIIPFDKELVEANNKKIKQRVAISSYQKNIVPNYLKGTKRNDLQGLLVNKKCG